MYRLEIILSAVDQTDWLTWFEFSQRQQKIVLIPQKSIKIMKQQVITTEISSVDFWIVKAKNLITFMLFCFSIIKIEVWLF